MKINDSYSEFTTHATASRRGTLDTLSHLDLYQDIGKSIVAIPIDDMLSVKRKYKDAELEAKKVNFVRKALIAYRLHGEVVILADEKEVIVCNEDDLSREEVNTGEYHKVTWRNKDIKEFPFSMHLIRDDLSSRIKTKSTIGVSILEDCKGALMEYRVSMEIALQILKAKTIDVLSVEGLDRALISANGRDMAQKRVEAIAQFRSVFSLMLLDANTEFKTIEKNIAGIPPTIEEFKVRLCSASRIPMSRLFGKTQSGLAYAGRAENNNYINTLREYQLLSSGIFIYLDKRWGDKSEFNTIKKQLDYDKISAINAEAELLIKLKEKGVIDNKTLISSLKEKGIL